MSTKLRKSKQRQRILDLLQSGHIHVTANWVYDELRNEFPTLSLGNVYRNLNILVDQGLANRLGFGSTFDVYEANREGHFHFICDRCGAIEDVELPEQQSRLVRSWIETDRGHRISNMEVHGICESCLAVEAGQVDDALKADEAQSQVG